MHLLISIFMQPKKKKEKEKRVGNRRRSSISGSDFCRYLFNKEVRQTSLEMLWDSLLSKKVMNSLNNTCEVWYFFSYLMGGIIVSIWFHLYVVNFCIGMFVHRWSDLCQNLCRKRADHIRCWRWLCKMIVQNTRN